MDLCYPTEPLTGVGLRIRPWRLDDLDCIAAAWVAPDNLASQRTLLRAGFALEGRLRRFLELSGRVTDGLVYSRVVADPTNPDDTARLVGHPESAAHSRGPNEGEGQRCR